jgi:uncharacterized membrane protein YedE/YeeE
MDFIYKPWPWYLAGPLIGLTVPLLLLLGNKQLGVSSTLRQICAACLPAGALAKEGLPAGALLSGRPHLKYEWKKDIWNLFFVSGILVGGFLGGIVFANPDPVAISQDTIQYLMLQGLNSPEGLIPRELFNWSSLTTPKGFLLMVSGGFLVGLGTRYAQGCTSGHGILGLSALQWPSLVATACFFLGGALFSRFILPLILAL